MMPKPYSDIRNSITGGLASVSVMTKSIIHQWWFGYCKLHDSVALSSSRPHNILSAWYFLKSGNHKQSARMEKLCNGTMRRQFGVKAINNNNNHKQCQILWIDNFYTSLPLMVYLRTRGNYSLGTMRSNRFRNWKLLIDKSDELEKSAGGYSTEFVGSACNVDLTQFCGKTWRISDCVKGMFSQSLFRNPIQ